MQRGWQPSRAPSVICRVTAERVTVSWLPLSPSLLRRTSQLLLNMKWSGSPQRVSMLLMRGALKVTAWQSWRREVEQEAVGRLLGQLFHRSDQQLGFQSLFGTDTQFHWTSHFLFSSTRSVDFLPYVFNLFPVSIILFPLQASEIHQKINLWHQISTSFPAPLGVICAKSSSG